MANILKVFISYCSDDNQDFPPILKDYFECSTGFNVFLASINLNTGDDFQEEILQNLATSDLFIPLFSKNFLTSIFANQEVGIAIEKGLKIMPISIDGTKPGGFIDRLHAYPCSRLNEQEVVDIVSVLFSRLIRDPQYSQFQEKAINSLTFSFLKCNSWKKTSVAFKLMKLAAQNGIKFNQIQLAIIKKGITTNDQVNTADLIMPSIREFLQNTYSLTIDN